MMDLPPLIDRKVFFGNPDRMNVKISPDGAHLSWVAPLDGVMNVWVAPHARLSEARALTRDTGRGVRHYEWAWTSEHLLYLQDNNGDENWAVHCADLAGGATRILTPAAGVQAQLVALSPKFPQEIIVGLNDRDVHWHDLHRLNVVTGKLELIQRNDRFAAIMVDDDYRLRLALSARPDGGMDIFRLDADNQWQPWEDIPPEDSLTTQPLDFDATGKVLFIRDSRGRNTAGLFAVDIGTGRKRLLAEDAKADALEVLMHPSEKRVQAVSFEYERTRWQVVDDSVAADLEVLRTLGDGDIHVLSCTFDDRYWVVLRLVDNGPGRFYLYDRRAREASFLFTNRKELEGLVLAKMRSAVIRSRDGLDLVVYYTLPVNADSNDDGIPDRPLPTVFTPHGGPWYRDSWGYSGLDQWLANRGYAVLSVNFRSSTGFGKEFLNAGDLQWGGKIHEDQIDAVRWAASAGIADPRRTAVMGGSFGGYSTLAGLTFSPEVFACGVGLCGPSNLITMMESFPPYWKPLMDVFCKRVGDHRTEEGRALLERHSPLRSVERICRPLLIAQGANDPRVKQAESDQIVKAMQAKGIPVSYLLYGDEGHGFVRPENNMSFHAVAEAFLARCLGGRCQPIGEDLEGSSMQLLAGGENVAGLAEALAGRKKTQG